MKICRVADLAERNRQETIRHLGRAARELQNIVARIDSGEIVNGKEARRG